MQKIKLRGFGESGEYLANWMEYYEAKVKEFEEELNKLTKDHRGVIESIIEKDIEKLKELKFNTVNFDRKFKEFEELFISIKDVKNSIEDLVQRIYDSVFPQD
jgi:hypothetical protein